MVIVGIFAADGRPAKSADRFCTIMKQEIGLTPMFINLEDEDGKPRSPSYLRYRLSSLAPSNNKNRIIVVSGLFSPLYTSAFREHGIFRIFVHPSTNTRRVSARHPDAIRWNSLKKGAYGDIEAFDTRRKGESYGAAIASHVRPWIAKLVKEETLRIQTKFLEVVDLDLNDPSTYEGRKFDRRVCVGDHRLGMCKKYCGDGGCLDELAMRQGKSDAPPSQFEENYACCDRKNIIDELGLSLPSGHLATIGGA